MKKAAIPCRERGLKKWDGVKAVPLSICGRCGMGKFRFYHIKEEYIAYLHEIDQRVQYNKGQRRPYVGIVLTVGTHDYYVPLESPKCSHSKLKSSGPILKLEDGALGIMGFNNMLPVLACELIEIDFEHLSDVRYRMLLQNQARCCNRMATEIQKRAETTYRKATDRKNQFYQKVCCDFKALEIAAEKYIHK